MTLLKRLAWLPFFMGAKPALAHSPVPGIEGFYVGLIHPFSTPPQALLMIGLALLVGGFAPERARWVFSGFVVASFIGLFAAIGIEELDVIMFAVAFAACALAALLPGKVLPFAIAITCAGAFLIGDASVPDDGPARDRLFTMSGSMVGANIGLLYLFGVSLVIRERYTMAWVTIAFRVAAAWLGAISLLMLALGFAEGVPPAQG